MQNLTIISAFIISLFLRNVKNEGETKNAKFNSN